MRGTGRVRMCECVGHLEDLAEVSEIGRGGCLWQDGQWGLGLGGKEARLRNVPGLPGF